MNDRGGLGARVRVAVCLAAIGGVACSDPPPAPKPVEDPTPAVLGTLREGYTGRPISAGEVILGTREATVATAKLDEAGHFRFDHPPAREHVFLSWKPGPAASAQLGINVPNDHYEVPKVPGDDHRDELDLTIVRPKPLDMGDVTVWLEDLGKQAYGGVCANGPPSAGAAPVGTPAVFLVKDEPGRPFALSNKRQPELIRVWPSGWRGIACIAETRTEVGSYGGVSGYRTTWRVRVVLLPDGQALNTTLSANPPRSISGNELGRALGHENGVRGDPRPLLQDWLLSHASAKS